MDFIMRHVHGDWSEMTPESQEENREALANGYRMLSSYKIHDKTLWLITEWDRSVTTLLLPDEY
jgi:hypothetical protein